MGKDRTVVQNSGSQQTTYAPDPSLTKLNELQFQQAQAADPMQREVNANAFNVINKLLTGDAAGLPGFLGTLAQGINPDVTTGLVGNALTDMNTQLAKSGAGTFLESGAAQSIGARTAGDIRLASEESNLNRLLNLLNIGVGGQAQIQNPILATSSMLGQRLGALAGQNVTTNGFQSTTAMNPFLKSFQTAAGSNLGGANFGAGPFNFYGGH